MMEVRVTHIWKDSRLVTSNLPSPVELHPILPNLKCIAYKSQRARQPIAKLTTPWSRAPAATGG